MKKLTLSFACLLTVSAIGALAAGPPNIAWNPNAEADITSYVLHVGTNSGTYQNSLSLSAPLTIISSKLLPWFPGQTNFVTVTAVNSTGFESGFSNEIAVSIPANPKALRLALESAPTPSGPWTEETGIDWSEPMLAKSKFYRGRLTSR